MLNLENRRILFKRRKEKITNCPEPRDHHGDSIALSLIFPGTFVPDRDHRCDPGHKSSVLIPAEEKRRHAMGRERRAGFGERTQGQEVSPGGGRQAGTDKKDLREGRRGMMGTAVSTGALGRVRDMVKWEEGTESGAQ